jgi:hypothetical protein
MTIWNLAREFRNLARLRGIWNLSEIWNLDFTPQ